MRQHLLPRSYHHDHHQLRYFRSMSIHFHLRHYHSIQLHRRRQQQLDKLQPSKFVM
jgi:hypothetical protein